MHITNNISKFQFITNPFSKRTHIEQTEKVCMAGCKWVQVRVKDKPEEEWMKIVQEIKEVCIQFNATLIVNDNVQLAKETGADGVHLGKNDLLPSEARKILGNDFIIGGTANTFEDIVELNKQKVDYIGLGPYRYTSTKKNLSPVLGLEGYTEIISLGKKNGINIPVIAIGGIEKQDIINLLNIGIYGVAVSSVITRAEYMETETKDLLMQFNYYKNYGKVENC